MSTEPDLVETFVNLAGDPVLVVTDPLASTPELPAEPAPAPAAPAEQPTEAPAVEPEPDQTALLEVEAACKICRGAGENYTFKNDQPYLNHLKQDHPECFQPAYE